jgi:hypothetical protein
MMTMTTNIKICCFSLVFLFLSLLEISHCTKLHRRPLSLSHSHSFSYTNLPDDDRSLQSSSSSFSTAIKKLTASDGNINNFFGSDNAVAISKNRIVIGALGNNGKALFTSMEIQVIPDWVAPIHNCLF